jgi:hypothetical protein
MKVVRRVLVLIFLLLPAMLLAGEADVVRIEVDKSGSSYSFDVSVQHSDEGWQHYTDKWDIVGPNGKILATRVLYHPHVSEQPFTRSLSGIEIGTGISSVIVRAHDLVHGYGGQEMTVELPR